MADLQAIREGLAASMHVLVGDNHVKQVSPWRLDNPSGASLQVSGIRDVVWDTFGDGASIRFLVQAMVPRSTDVGAQKTLDRLLFDPDGTSLTEALEADQKLTGRYTVADGLQTGQAAAASGVGVENYEGEVTFKTADTDYLIGTWVVLVTT